MRLKKNEWWMVVLPNGEIWPNSARGTKKESQEVLASVQYQWCYWRKQGYRCVVVVIAEAKRDERGG
jgi:hypothetical protein